MRAPPLTCGRLARRKRLARAVQRVPLVRIDEAIEPIDRWDVRLGDGPVLATAVHAGHDVRPELLERLALSDAARRREEDPMTGVWAEVADDVFRCNVSRFEVDLNRSPQTAVYRCPDDAWGLQVWKEPPTEAMVERSMQMHRRFYAFMKRRIEFLIERHGSVLLLDVHSYNHRRGGPDARPAPAQSNPDIDLGVTTVDGYRFEAVTETLLRELPQTTAGGRRLDVRANIRFPDGGYWPEWVFANYFEEVCTVTLEYKKIYVDEWSGAANLAIVEDLRRGLEAAVAAARGALRGARVAA